MPVEQWPGLPGKLEKTKYMSNKTAKFLICENPMVEDGRVFILHMRKPKLLAEAFHFELEEEDEWMECKRQFALGASVDYPGELIALGAIWGEENDLDADQLAKLMSRMGDWYRAYLEWEDEQMTNFED